MVTSSIRAQILEVNKNGHKSDILARDLKQDKHIKVSVEGVWAQNQLLKDSIINLVNPEYDLETETYLITNSSGLLVTQPDNLLTCTVVASSLFCERRTWLNNVFVGQFGTNRAMLVGTLVHEVFQYGVKNRIADLSQLNKYLDELLDDATVMLEIYSIEAHLKEVRDEAISYLPSVKEWIEKYMFVGPRYPLSNDPNLEVKIIGVTDIEENVWSTMYGLKGKIDVTGSVRVYDKRSKTVADKTIPLELKTGNPNLSASHAAQVSLYSMMIEDKYSETNQGFVIYLKNKAAMHNVALTHNIRRDLIQRRNLINQFSKDYQFGPEMLNQPNLCRGCERLSECVLVSNLYQPNKIDEYPGMKSLEPEAVGHLDEKFMKFFESYHEKLSIMARRGDLRNSFWTWSSDKAEEQGSGFGQLQATCNGNSSMITFKRHPKSKENNNQPPVVKKVKLHHYFKPIKAKKPFNTEVDFSRCRLAISEDNQKEDSVAIAIGFMQELKENHFVMKLYEGSIDLLKPDLMYRVDKLEKETSTIIERSVLVRLLVREDWRCDRVRQLLFDSTYRPEDNVKLNLFILSTCFEEISQLKSAHQKAVVHAAASDNYYIIDETIEPDKKNVHKLTLALAKVLTTLERSLLITAGNIDDLVGLMKLLQHEKMKFILIDDGKSTSARFQFASYLVKVVQNENWDIMKKFDSYIKQHEMAPIVITTYAKAMAGLLFARRTFDYCIGYDCDSTELLLSLTPMFCSDRHIIIDIKDDEKPISGKDTTTLGEHLRATRRDSSTKQE